MQRVLSNLHEGHPVVGSKLLAAVITLRVLLHKLHQLGRLHLHVGTNLPIEHNLELESLGVRLSPDKVGGLELDFVETLDLLQQNSHHFLALPLAVDPGRSLEPHAVSAVIDVVALEHLFLLQGLDGARGADRAGRGDELDAAQGAQNGGLGLHDHHCCNTFIMLYRLNVVLPPEIYYFTMLLYFPAGPYTISTSRRPVLS